MGISKPHTWRVAGAVLVALTLSACGQIPTRNNAATPPNPPSSPVESSTTPSSQTGQTAENPTSDTSAPAPPKPAPTPARPKTQRCHTSMLAASLENPDAGAGQRYLDLVLRNKSPQQCTLYGYGGMRLLDDQGKPVPTKMRRDTASPGPELIVLKPGESARAMLKWTVVPADDEHDPCEPAATHAFVTPPDETDPLTVAWNSGSVCQHGEISDTAYHK